MSDIKKKHLMIDIETMGLRHNAPVMSIGAVWFDPEQNGWQPKNRAFYCRFEQNEVLTLCKDGLDAGTILWWLEQDDASRKEITDPEGTVPVGIGISALERFILSESEDPDVRDVYVWGNSDTFDIGTLGAFIQKAGFKIPWNYGRDANCRTVVWLSRLLTGMDKPKDMRGVKHNALHDAEHQAKYIEAMVTRMRACMITKTDGEQLTETPLGY